MIKAIISTFAVAIAAIVLFSATGANAAPSDCMGASSDGTTICSAPLLSDYSYGVCISNALSTTEAASDYCGAANGPLNSEGSIINYMRCLPVRQFNACAVTSPSVLNWLPTGSTDPNFLCFNYAVVNKWGAEIHGFAEPLINYISANSNPPHSCNVPGTYYQTIARRDRAPSCPEGYVAINDTSGALDYCVRTPSSTCKVGNPTDIATREKVEFDRDFASGNALLSFSRYYRAGGGFYRPISATTSAYPGFGDIWRHNYGMHLFPETSPYLVATLHRIDGKQAYFRSDGREVLNEDGGNGRLTKLTDSVGNTLGWYHRSNANNFEVYDDGGRLSQVRQMDGRGVSIYYSDGSTPLSVAPGPGYLIRVVDTFGRSLSFSYDSGDHFITMVTPNGEPYAYSFNAYNMLSAVTYPDASVKQYFYGENNTAAAGQHNLMTGIQDENGTRFANFDYTYRYSAYRVATTQHAGGANFYRFDDSSTDATVIIVYEGDTFNGLRGTARVVHFANIAGVYKVLSQTQGSGAGCGPSAAAMSYDSRGNLTSSTDYNGNVTSFGYESARNLEVSRTEGVGSPSARMISSQWHPVWQVKTRLAEPKKLTTNVYNGQPDPFNAGAPASCAPSTATLPDGSPIAVLCKRVEQTTTDADGSQGFAATTVGTPRMWQWTYNADGQVLTAKGPRTDVDDTTTSVYRAADDTSSPMKYRRGDLYTVTDALGHVTTMSEYDGNGRPTKTTDPNGLIATMTYSPRGWLTSQTATSGASSEATSFSYDSVGQLLKVTQPDGSYVNYTYDAAHRMTDVADSLGNTIHYTVDPMGNRIQEQAKDPSGTLAKNITRAYDALNRLQTVTGALQ